MTLSGVTEFAILPSSSSCVSLTHIGEAVRTGRSRTESGGWGEEAQKSSPYWEWGSIAFLHVFCLQERGRHETPCLNHSSFSPSRPSASLRYLTPSAPHFFLALKTGCSLGAMFLVKPDHHLYPSRPPPLLPASS